MKRISETYLFLRGGKWYFGLRVDGRQIKLSTKTADRSEAERIAAAYRLQLMGEMSLKHGKITECASVYRERFLRDRPINALRQHDAMLKRLLEFIGRDAPLSSITSYKAEDWLLTRNLTRIYILHLYEEFRSTLPIKSRGIEHENSFFFGQLAWRA